MNPEDLPLEPLIAPPPVGWWPLAPIWWILIAITILIFIIVTIYRFRKYLKHKKPAQPIIEFDVRRKAALNELAHLTKPYGQDAGEWLQQLNILLKRLCAIRYPNQNTHVLLGQEWLDFLDQHCPDAHIAQFPMLVDGLYRNNYQLDDQTIDALYSSIKYWITYHV